MQIKGYRKSVLFLFPFPSFISNWRMILLTGALLPKHIVSTLTFELETRLKLNVYEVGLFLRHLSGYNSSRILKPVNPYRLPGRFDEGLILSLKTHVISHKPKEETSFRRACTQRIYPCICCAL